MAKTFIGELILRFKDESAAGAKKSAADISGSLGKIEAAAKRLNSMPWGGQFTKQLDKLGASSKDMDKLRSAWDRLYEDMQSKNLSKALQKSELGAWKNSALQHFIAQQKGLRDELDKSEKRARSWRDSMQNITKAGLGMAGAYGGAYGAIVLGKGGIEASADWEREKYRLAQTGYSQADQDSAIKNSQAITMKYPQISGTQALELTKSAIAATGGVDEGIDISQLLAKAQAVYQSQGKDGNVVAEMAQFTKGGELTGLIKPGPGGTDRFKTALDNWIKFSQIEGQYMSMSDFFTMSRRAKGAFAGANDDFIALLPHMGVEMTAPGAGTAFSSLNNTYLNNATGAGFGKAQKAEQERIGIRDDNGIVGRREFQANPAAWTLKYLIPALQRNGVNIDDPGDVQAEMRKIIGNANAANMQGMMVNQRAMIAKGIEQRQGAVGLDTADDARYKDPFSGWIGFVNSLKNLAAAVGEGPMETAVKGLNAMTDGINRLQSAWRDGGALAKVGIGAGVGLGAFGTFKAISGVYALATAGPALTAAAVSLEGAAASIVAANGETAVAGLAGLAKAGGKGKLLGLASVGGAISSLSEGLFGPRMAIALAAAGGVHALWHPGAINTAPRYAFGVDDMIRRIMGTGNAAPQPTDATLAGQRAASSGANPLQAAVDHASSVGGQMKAALSITAKPVLDLSGLDAGIAKAREFNSLLGVSASLARQSASDVSLPPAGTSVARDMNRSFADHGIKP